MNYHYIYDLATGQLISESSLVIDPIPGGIGVKIFSREASLGIWNASTLQFDPRPQNKKEDKLVFIDRFSDSELEGIMAARRTNDKVAVFVKKLDLAEDVDRSSVRTVTAVNGLEAIGLIVSGRAAEILA